MSYSVNVRDHVQRVEVDPAVAAAEATQIAEQARLERLKVLAARHQSDARIAAVRTNCTIRGWTSLCEQIADGVDDGEWTEAQATSGEIHERLFAELR
jgi:hypothetical protein